MAIWRCWRRRPASSICPMRGRWACSSEKQLKAQASRDLTKAVHVQPTNASELNKQSGSLIAWRTPPWDFPELFRLQTRTRAFREFCQSEATTFCRDLSWPYILMRCSMRPSAHVIEVFRADVSTLPAWSRGRGWPASAVFLSATTEVHWHCIGIHLASKFVSGDTQQLAVLNILSFLARQIWMAGA